MQNSDHHNDRIIMMFSATYKDHRCVNKRFYFAIIVMWFEWRYSSFIFFGNSYSLYKEFLFWLQYTDKNYVLFLTYSFCRKFKWCIKQIRSDHSYINLIWRTLNDYGLLNFLHLERLYFNEKHKHRDQHAVAI